MIKYYFDEILLLLYNNFQILLTIFIEFINCYECDKILVMTVYIEN